MSTARSLLARLRQYRPGRLASNTLNATIWQVVRLGGQLLVLIVVARTLGPDGYGTLVGFGSLAIMLSGVFWVGGSYLMLQAVARDASLFGRYWRATRNLVLQSGLVLTLLFSVIAPHVLQLPLTLTSVAAIAFAELLCAPLVYAAGYAFQSHERLGWANALPALLTLLRLAAATAFLLGHGSQLNHYVLIYVSASVAAALLALYLVQHLLQPQLQAQHSGPSHYRWAEWRAGMHFSASGLTTNAYGEMDKVLAVRFLSAGPAGAYAAAYRLLTVLILPVVSLLQAAQPRFFRLGHASDARALRRLLAAVTGACAVYAVLAAGLVLVLAPYLTVLLGPGFASSIAAAHLLAPLLPLLCLRMLAVTLLTGLGRPGLRAVMEAIAAVVLMLGCALVVPRFGLPGMVACLLTVEALMLAAMSAAAWQLMRKQTRPAPLS